MDRTAWKTDLLMIGVAAIWGSTFVAQQLGMNSVGPFTYTAARMVLGVALIAPLWWWRGGPFAAIERVTSTGLWRDGTLLGLVLFAALNLQQVGLLGTTVANAGFITGLYAVLVPILMRLLGQPVGQSLWLAAGLATAGLYLLSVRPDTTIAPGDWLQLGGAVLWAVHVLLVGHWARRHDAIRLSIVQYLVAGALSLVVALLRAEVITLEALSDAAGAIAWGGFLSIGVAYTLQVVAQRTAKAAHAAVIYSSEGIFAAIGGWLVLDEDIGLRGWSGAILIVAGMLLAHLDKRSCTE